MSDLIDREAAINAFYAATADGDKAEFCVDVIKGLPTVPAAPRWVRCEEDKPKERDYYFAFTADAEVFVGEYIPSVDQWWNGDDLILTVTHWMPIEPPQEES